MSLLGSAVSGLDHSWLHQAHPVGQVVVGFDRTAKGNIQYIVVVKDLATHLAVHPFLVVAGVVGMNCVNL